MKRRTARKAVNLRQAVEGLKPLVKSLLQLEHDLLGVDANYEAIPARCEGPQRLLDGLQADADARARRLGLVGKLSGDWTAPDDVRRVLAAIESLAEATGVRLDTARRTPTAPPWTSRDAAYEGIGPGDVKQIAGSKWRLAYKARLKPDGSLARPLPEPEEAEEEE